jgi:ankyrin repeat protein
MGVELLEEYIQTGNTSALKQLLDVSPELAQVKTSSKVSPLLLSCYYKKPEITGLLLGYIPEPDIFEAAAIGKFDRVANHIYLHPGAINAFSDDGFTPLGLACYFGHEEIARYLLLKGAEVNLPSQNSFGVYPLHSAAAANNLDITKIVLEAGADVNVRQQSGFTPLHAAAQHGNIEMLILLLEAGADVGARTDAGLTPSNLATERGFHDIARILCE